MSNNIENITELSDILRIEGVNSKGFGILPKLVMQDQRLTRDAKALYGYFCSFAGAGDTAFPGVDKICADLCFKSQDTFRKHLSILKSYNYIKVDQIRSKGKFARNIYILVNNPNPHQEGTCDLPSPKFSGTVESTEKTDVVPSPKKPVPKNSCTKNWVIKNNSIKNNNIKTTTDKKVVVDDSDEDEFLEKKDEVEEIKKEIQDVIGADIHHKIVKELIGKKGLEKIKHYLENWSLLTQTQSINNVAGFFNKAVMDEYPIPVTQSKGPLHYSTKATQCGNFEQRQYDDEFYDNLYDNMRGERI